MDYALLMEFTAYVGVALLLSSVLYSHRRREQNLKPTHGREPPYMVYQMDFTQFPRSASHHTSVVWIKAKFEELGKKPPTLALCEALIEDYYRKFPGKMPTVAELRAQEEA